MSLFDIFKKKITPVQKHSNHEVQPNLQERGKINIKFYRTAREEELSFNFSQTHSSKLSKLENELFYALQAIGKTGPKWIKTASKEEINTKIQACEKAIVLHNKLKTFCIKTSKGGSIYFEDMYEHCHNSKNPDFRYIQSTEDTLKRLQDHLNTLT